MPWVKVEPVLLDCLPGELCRKRYAGHSKGCPNHGKRQTCPPQARLWTPDYCWGKDWYAIFNIFPFGEHAATMSALHPDWSRRQCECCLYWQGRARKELRAEVARFLRKIPPPLPEIEYIPEAHGVNVTETMRRVGIELEWPPVSVTYQIALVELAGERCLRPKDDQ
jgi:hypothetical protein